jgi:hypothetical protein
MSNDTINRRMVQIGISIVLIVLGFSSFGSDFSAALVFVGLGLFLLYRQFQQTQNNLGGEERRGRAPRWDDSAAAEAQPRADQVYTHALDAVNAAGLDPNTTHVLPIDIGVMAFSADQDPMIFRTKPVLDDVDYIQPFVQLRLPTRAVGRVRFEIVDSDGQVLFVHEDHHQLQRGRNLVTPSARLPIHDAHNMRGDWQLRISADGVLLAVHRFSWEESATKAIRRQLREDGELTNEVRAMLAENRLQKLSLDELLSDQLAEDESQRRVSGR